MTSEAESGAKDNVSGGQYVKKGKGDRRSIGNTDGSDSDGKSSTDDGDGDSYIGRSWVSS